MGMIPHNIWTYHVICTDLGFEHFPSGGSVKITKVETILGKKYITGEATGAFYDPTPCTGKLEGAFTLQFRTTDRGQFSGGWAFLIRYCLNARSV